MSEPLTQILDDLKRAQLDRRKYRDEAHLLTKERDEAVAERDELRARIAKAEDAYVKANNWYRRMMVAEARIAAALDLHRQDTQVIGLWCNCGLTWPCPTVRALSPEYTA